MKVKYILELERSEGGVYNFTEDCSFKKKIADEDGYRVEYVSWKEKQDMLVQLFGVHK